jgi:predicted transcriptional regulator of viral defense system
MSTAASLGRLAGLAEAQDGLVTSRQADLCGVPRRDLTRLAQSGGLERVAYGVYRVAGAPGVDLDRRTVADGVVSHASAANLYGAGLPEPPWHAFTVPLPRRMRSRRDDVVIHRAPLGADEAQWVEEMLVTVPARLVADLAAQSIDGEHLACVVTDLLRARLVSRGELRSALAPHASRYGWPGDGRGFLDDLLGVVS